jgi:hypothetical protein
MHTILLHGRTDEYTTGLEVRGPSNRTKLKQLMGNVIARHKMESEVGRTWSNFILLSLWTAESSFAFCC